MVERPYNMSTNPIYIVDDDPDDQEILSDVFKELGLNNEIFFFETAESVLKQLIDNSAIPFLIISDINLPMMDGFELRKRILENESIMAKTVPFIFWSTTGYDTQVQHAYDVSAQGFFLKGNNYNEVKESMKDIINYWSKSKAPDQVG
jgi:CheY-like chemotaxis protein